VEFLFVGLVDISGIAYHHCLNVLSRFTMNDGNG